MKGLLLAVAAAVVLAGCACNYKAKCYPYPVYDYSPARACASGCPTGTTACAVCK